MNNLKQRRDFFQKHLPVIKTREKKSDGKSASRLKNTCPACGYLTLHTRAAFEICPICFWEDDGFDDPEAEEVSQANQETLKEYRKNIQRMLDKIRYTDFPFQDIKKEFKEKFIEIDELIDNYTPVQLDEIMRAQEELIGLFISNKIFGLTGLLERK
jgi:ribosomal protein S14